MGAFRAATEEERAEFLFEMCIANTAFDARMKAARGIVVAEVEEKKEVAVAAKEPKAKEPKALKAKEPKAKEPKAPKADIPQGDLSEAPGPEHYRLKEVNEGLCKARKTEGGEDRRWKPLVYGESQCTRKPVEGEELCKICATCFEKESQDDKFKKWHGLVTEDLLAHTHILGSEWASKCKWVGTAPPSVSAPASAPASAPESAAASESEEAPVSSSSSAPVATPAKEAKEAKAPPAAPKKAAKAPAKAPAKAKAEAKKEAPAPVAPAAAAAAVAEPVAEAGELKLLGGEFYWVSRGNVYEYDQIEETPGDFVGRLRADESIDADAEEETAE